MTSCKLYSFDEMWVKERQNDLWRQAKQARQRHEARRATRGSRVHLFRAIGDYLADWLQTQRWRKRPGTRLETYESPPRIRHAAS